jgi:hypothetical protein
MVFKLGRLPRDLTRYAPTYEDYRASGGLHVIPNFADVNRATKVPQWPMYCNDRLNCCTVAGIAHVIAAMTVYGDHPFPLFPDDEIIRIYSAVSGYDPMTGANDNGASMQAVLDYVRTNGITDRAGKTHRVVMYAAFGTPNSPALLAEVLNVFGAVYTGVHCPKSAMTEFGKLWTWSPDSPIVGGHAIGLHRRMSYSANGPFDWSTWGALQQSTLGFAEHYIEESWAVVSEDWLASNGKTCGGLDLAQLEVDMHLV